MKRRQFIVGLRRREFIAGLDVVALRLRPERRARRSQQTTRRLAIALNGWGFGTASNYRQPIARTAFQAIVPVSQVLS
jgi:hypothetical protein